jgi:Protein of unknown function (DUF3800)
LKSANVFCDQGLSYLFPSESSWQMTVSAFFDESGKFKDHKVIVMACVAAFADQVNNDFAPEWGRLLRLHGLKYLTAKKALNHRRPLSEKNPALGVAKRTKALTDFVMCIRKHLQVVIGCAVDVRYFKKLPPHFFQVYGHDPSYLAFVRAILQVSDFAPDGEKISIICDEDEETALPFYKLYRRIKKVLPSARKKLAAVSFADDKVMYALQAADLVASLLRLDSNALLTKTPHDYKRLLKAIQRPPERHERLWFCGVATADKASLLKTAQNTTDDLKRRKLLE